MRTKYVKFDCVAMCATLLLLIASMTEAAGAACPCSIWPATAMPAVAADTDASAVELGIKFQSDTAGVIRGIRFYKGRTNTGTHVANLWDSSGTKLATATFTNETTTGWQQVNFSVPVAIIANTTYVASYLAPRGQYSVTEPYFANGGVDNPPLHALANSVGPNGVYKYGGGFPTATWNSTNYWVDVVFDTTATVDTTPPTVTAFTIPATATALNVPISNLTATDNVGVTAYLVNESSSTPLATSVGWTATAPSSYAFGSAGSKTLYAWAKDAAGNVSAGKSATVTITILDTTRPTVTAFAIPATATTLTVPITTLTATDNVGVTGYLVTTSATKPSAAAAGWTATAPSSYTFGSAGSKTLYAWAKDAAGNVSAGKSATVTYYDFGHNSTHGDRIRHSGDSHDTNRTNHHSDGNGQRRGNRLPGYHIGHQTVCRCCGMDGNRPELLRLRERRQQDPLCLGQRRGPQRVGKQEGFRDHYTSEHGKRGI